MNSVGAKAFANMSAKIKVKVPKKVKKSYTTILTKKGLSKKAKIK